MARAFTPRAYEVSGQMPFTVRSGALSGSDCLPSIAGTMYIAIKSAVAVGVAGLLLALPNDLRAQGRGHGKETSAASRAEQSGDRRGRGPDQRPPGWDRGRKEGWHGGSLPPGLARSGAGHGASASRPTGESRDRAATPRASDASSAVHRRQRGEATARIGSTSAPHPDSAAQQVRVRRPSSENGTRAEPRRP